MFAVEAIRTTYLQNTIHFADNSLNTQINIISQSILQTGNCLTRYKNGECYSTNLLNFNIYIISSQRSTTQNRICLPATSHAEHILLNLFHAAEFVFTTSKCPLCLFLLMAGVVPVLNSITPSLPLTSLCETDSV